MTRDDRPLGTRVAELEARVQALEARLMEPAEKPNPHLPQGSGGSCTVCHGAGQIHFPGFSAPTPCPVCRMWAKATQP